MTVGFGTPAGATIPIREGNARRREARREGQRRDHAVSSGDAARRRRRRRAARSSMPAETRQGGEDPARARAAAWRAARASRRARTQTPRFQLFLIPAVLLLLLDTRARRASRPSPARRGGAAPRPPRAAARSLLARRSSPRPAARADDVRDAAREYNAKRYMRAARAVPSRARAGRQARREVLYNLGTALLAADSLGVGDRGARASRRRRRTRRCAFARCSTSGSRISKRGPGGKGDSATPSLDAALETYKRALLMRSSDGDAKWNYELALRKKKQSGGGGGGGGSGRTAVEAGRAPAAAVRPAGGLGSSRRSSC